MATNKGKTVTKAAPKGKQSAVAKGVTSTLPATQGTQPAGPIPAHELTLNVQAELMARGEVKAVKRHAVPDVAVNTVKQYSMPIARNLLLLQKGMKSVDEAAGSVEGQLRATVLALWNECGGYNTEFKVRSEALFGNGQNVQVKEGPDAYFPGSVLEDFEAIGGELGREFGKKSNVINQQVSRARSMIEWMRNGNALTEKRGKGDKEKTVELGLRLIAEKVAAIRLQKKEQANGGANGSQTSGAGATTAATTGEPATQTPVKLTPKQQWAADAVKMGIDQAVMLLAKALDESGEAAAGVLASQLRMIAASIAKLPKTAEAKKAAK